MSTKFYINNEIDHASAVVSSENAQFPLTNLSDPRRSKIFRSTSNADSITMDFGYPVLIDTVMIVDDPMTGNKLSSCIVKIDNASNFSTAITQSMTIDPINGFSHVEFNTTVPVRYLRIEMTAVSGFCEMAKLFAGTKVSLGSEIDFSLPLSYSLNSRAIVTTNRYGQRFVDEVNTQKKINGSMKALDKDELDGLLEIFDYSMNTKPLWIKFDGVLNAPNRISGYYYMSNAPQMTLDSSLYWSVSLDFEEAL